MSSEERNGLGQSSGTCCSSERRPGLGPSHSNSWQLTTRSNADCGRKWLWGSRLRDWGGGLPSGRKALLPWGFTSKEAHGHRPDSSARRVALITALCRMCFPLLNKHCRSYRGCKISVVRSETRLQFQCATNHWNCHFLGQKMVDYRWFHMTWPHC